MSPWSCTQRMEGDALRLGASRHYTAGFWVEVTNSLLIDSYTRYDAVVGIGTRAEERRYTTLNHESREYRAPAVRIRVRRPGLAHEARDSRRKRRNPRHSTASNIPLAPGYLIPMMTGVNAARVAARAQSRCRIQSATGGETL